MIRSSRILIAAALASLMAIVEPRTLNFMAVWFQRPYNGPEIVVEIVGADMNERANRFFDYWSKPDIFVTVMHGESDRSTQIEGNTYLPRFLWKTKIPFNENMGLHFHVMEANVVKGNDVMGRAFIDKEQIQEMLEEGGSFLLSVGENIGVIKVNISHPPADLKIHGPFSSSTKRLEGPRIGEKKIKKKMMTP